MIAIAIPNCAVAPDIINSSSPLAIQYVGKIINAFRILPGKILSGNNKMNDAKVNTIAKAMKLTSLSLNKQFQAKENDTDVLANNIYATPISKVNSIVQSCKIAPSVQIITTSINNGIIHATKF